MPPVSGGFAGSHPPRSSRRRKAGGDGRPKSSALSKERLAVGELPSDDSTAISETGGQRIVERARRV